MPPISGFEIYSKVSNYKALRSPLVSAENILVDTGFSSHMSEHEKKEKHLSYNAYTAVSHLSDTSDYTKEDENSTAEELAEIYSQAAYRDNAITVISLANNKPGNQVDLIA
ncbi:hypothetical protein [Curvivirga aplysinae]|uniref:hypothetical protein n=1 Tax=Curvivirga aplysinae TaxID=2529852 RepID=UPI0012BBF50B|nr:hypothetical protein [Curvivirga aplysinae]MTI11473.1 hypothetical protein [Curvivirga aplysinae]